MKSKDMEGYMNKLLIYSLFIVMIFTKCCFSEELRDMKNSQENRTPDGVSIAVGLPKEEYRVLEPIDLKITITNGSNKDIFLVLTNVLKQGKFTILDTKRKKNVSFTLYGQQLNEMTFLSRSVITIKLANSYSYYLNISRVFDVSLSSEYSLDCEVFYLDSTKKHTALKIENLSFSISEEPL